jgi:xylan 1,4-beta-xylosidase
MTIEFFVDTTLAGTPFPHYWELCVGSGHAVMGLRQDWRDQLEKCHRELGFQYVRFHGLLDDAMSVCIRETRIFGGDAEGGLRVSFFNIDSIFDFLLKIGMKPFIELGFMPEALASGKETCFHYKANITPPADYGEWETLIRTLTQHLVDRYGVDEVRTWFFEVWNEPNLKFFWAGSQADYFKLYEHAARAIKSVDAQLRVGGPATSINAWIPDMIEFSRKADVPLDFVSTHHYPTDDPLWKNSDLTIEEFFQKFAHLMGQYERGVLQKMTARARSEAGNLPLYYTEWNSSAMVPDSAHDDSYAAALVAKTIADNDGLVEGYSFWTFSDLFEERGQFGAPFHGGFGLQTIHGIPKPTYRVFEMLHRLGNERIRVTGGADSTVEILAVKGKARLTILAYNHDIPGADIRTEEVSITLKGFTPSGPASIARIDAQNANPKQKWIDLGSPEYPGSATLTQIEQASRLIPDTLNTQPNAEGCTLRFTIPAHGIAEIRVMIT